MKKFKKIIAMGCAAVMAMSVMSIGVFATSETSSKEIKNNGTNQILATDTFGDINAEMNRLGLTVPEGVTPTEVGILPNTGLSYVLGDIDGFDEFDANANENGIMPLSDSWTGNVTIDPYVEGQHGKVIRTFTTSPGTTARLSWYGFSTASSLNLSITNNINGWSDYVMGLEPNKYWGLTGADPSHSYTWRGSINGTNQSNSIRFTNKAPY